MEELGEPRFRGDQIASWLYRQEVASFGEMTNLPAPLRARLPREFAHGRREPLSASQSADGTRKYLFPVGPELPARETTPDNGSRPSGPRPAAGPRSEPVPAPLGAAVETALIPQSDRLTLCVSTQAGCRRGCRFCQTGKQGFHGDLTAGEIVNQLLSLPARRDVTNVVFMGMGEPLDNLTATLRALELLTSPWAIGMSAQRITVSTVGIHPALESLLDATKVNLAVSLHSPFPTERRELLPVEVSHPLSSTLELLRRRREDRHRKLSMEYTIFDGVNHSPAHAKELARLLSGLSVRVNLIPYHPLREAQGGLRSPGNEAVAIFQQELRDRGIRTFIRRSRGEDIGAACGMLWTGDVSPSIPSRKL